MNDLQVNLFQLLKLVGKQLDEQGDAQIRREIAANSILAGRWRHVSKTWERLRQAEQPVAVANGEAPRSETRVLISRRTEYRDLRRAEAIAAFVEGRLDPKNASRIDQLCWKRPAWLSEVVCSFHDFHQPYSHDISTVDFGRLNERVASMVFEQKPPKTNQASIGPIQSSIVKRRVWNLSARTWAAAVAATLLLGVSYLAWMNFAAPEQIVQPNRNPTAEVKLAQPVAPENDSVVQAFDESEPRLSSIKFGDPESIADDETDEPDSIAAATDEAAIKDWPEILNEPAEDSDPLPIVADTIPNQPAASESIAVAIPINWRESKGILASRADSKNPWQGLETSLPDAERFEFATLPFSWARGDLGSLGALIVSDNSRVRLWQSKTASGEMAPGLNLELTSGQIALADLPNQTVIEVTAGPAFWKILVTGDKTSIAVEFDEETPQLAVVAGAVKLNDDLSLDKGEETSWMISRSLVSEKSKDRRRWIQSAPTNIRNASRNMDRKSLARVAASDDVIDELKSIALTDDVESVENRTVVARMLMSFEPQQFALEMLESNNAAIGRETLTWLFAQNPRQPRTQRIWIAISRKTRQPEKVRTLVNWIEMASHKSRVPLETARTMAEWLTDDQLLFRQSGHFFLNLAFGNQVEYDAQWPPEQRISAANQWRASIAEFYRTRRR